MDSSQKKEVASIALKSQPQHSLRSRTIGALRKFAGRSDASENLHERETRAATRHQLEHIVPGAEGLAQRAELRWAEDEIDRQKNREAIADQAAEILESISDQAETNSETELDSDWLNVFASFAEKASGESLRAMWARVLAGEIRKPGSVSLRTLQFASTLDKTTASAFQAMASWIANDVMMPHLASEHLPFETMHLLHDEGLIGSMDSDVSHTLTLPATWWAARFGGVAVFVKGTEGQTVKIPGISVSRVARELLSTISLTRDVAAPIAFAEWLKSQDAVQEIRVAHYVVNPDGTSTVPITGLISAWIRPKA